MVREVRYWLAFSLFLAVIVMAAIGLSVVVPELPMALALAVAIVVYFAAVELDLLPPGRPLARARREAKFDHVAPHTDMDDALYRAPQFTADAGSTGIHPTDSGAPVQAVNGWHSAVPRANRGRAAAAERSAAAFAQQASRLADEEADSGDPLYVPPRYSYQPYTPPRKGERRPLLLAAATALGVLAIGGLWFVLATLVVGGGGSNNTTSGGDGGDGGRIVSGALAATTPTPRATITPLPATATPPAPSATTVPATPTPATTVAPPVANLTGRWEIIDTVISSGQGAGQAYVFTVQLQESGSAITGVGDGLTITGTRQGNHVQVQFVQSGRTGVFEWTATSDAVLQGTFAVDNGGSSGRSIATRVR